MFRDVYDKIDELAKARNISRRRLAQLSGININTMSTLYKRRPVNFPDKYLIPIAAVLDVSPSEIRNANNLHLFPNTAEPPHTDADAAQVVDFANLAPGQTENQRATVGQVLSMIETLNRDELKIVSDYIAVLTQDS